MNGDSPERGATLTKDDRISMDDRELAVYLGVDNCDNVGDILRAIIPAERDAYEHMAWVEQELNAGRVPDDVIVCADKHPVFGRVK